MAQARSWRLAVEEAKQARWEYDAVADRLAAVVSETACAGEAGQAAA